MNNIYISIGAQCTTATLFDMLEVKKETLPFDWMFSTPHFVYSIIKQLVIDNKEIDYIVDNHFFLCDKRAILYDGEHHIFFENGPVLVNSKYNVCFPHDTLPDRDKYIRRIERLKQLILDNETNLTFVYVSVSSPDIGNYKMENVEPIQELYEYIDKINSILKEVRTNYKILIFDTNKPTDIINPDILHISYYDIEQKNHWKLLLPELINTCNNLIKNEVIYK